MLTETMVKGKQVTQALRPSEKRRGEMEELRVRPTRRATGCALMAATLKELAASEGRSQQDNNAIKDLLGSN